MKRSELIQIAESWFKEKGWDSLPFQREAWRHFLAGKHGLLNAPTGSGKTYALLVPVALDFIRRFPNDYQERFDSGLQLIWIAPIRALTKEIEHSATALCEGLGLNWRVEVRTGDTSAAVKARQKKSMPEILITTPESLHLILAQKNYPRLFRNLQAFVADEWHELLGSKRAVQTELALSRFKAMRPNLRIWGISATIGNLPEALEVLLGAAYHPDSAKMVQANIEKKIEVVTLLPDEIEEFPWAGHIGLTMLEKVLPIIEKSQTTLIFTNTRGQAEIWYQRLLAAAPNLAGLMAMHHGSIDKKIRLWVENELHGARLKAVVCTSSLDLGVDFRPVETIVQVGSPKGVARFMQRAGRSGHQPGATSKIYFLPTNTLELVESAALQQAMNEQLLEHRQPHIRSFDVLVQYAMTLAVSDGFFPEDLLAEIRATFCYQSISDDEWAWLMAFITHGGQSLNHYDEFHKVAVSPEGLFQVTSRRVALRHRLNIGTIVSETAMTVKMLRGARLGTIEEYFISQLNPGDVFWYAGRNLELVRVKGNVAQVRKSNSKAGKVPSWMGARMPLSTQMSEMFRFKLNQALKGGTNEIEMQTVMPLIEKQQQLSKVPGKDEFLIEKLKTRDGHHVFFYPFEGRFVHEGMASLIAYRISLLQPITFSIALNDYGFELLSDQEIPIEDAIDTDIFSPEHLYDDINASINSTEMARRKFRDIASISGLIFKGFPGKFKKDRHIQSSSQLFFEVFHDYEPSNLLLRQSFEEVLEFQLQETRMRAALTRISKQSIVLMEPQQFTPFSFPLMVDRLREKMTSEKLEDRIRKMKLKLEA